MSLETFERALYWVEKFDNVGLQGELSFTGIGESTMHPEFGNWLIEARARFPKIPIVFSTNGLPTFTEELAALCQEHRIEVMISTHRPEMAGRAVVIAKKYKVLKFINTQFVDAAFDWGGKVDWPVSAPALVCEYLKSGWGVVLFDGQITTCCLDSENEGVVGSVWDEPGMLQLAPYKLCKGCHMKIA